MKKVISILISLVMAISLIPISASAQTEYIDEVYVKNIPTPIDGRTWQGAQPAVFSDAPYELCGFEWYDETEDRAMKNNETFKMGHVYTVRAWLKPKSGYEFDATPTGYNMKGYFNPGGNLIEAELSKDFEYQTWAMVILSHTFPAVEELKEITYVAITDVKEPKIGRQSIAKEQYLKYSDDVEGLEAFWLENYDWDNHFTGIFSEQKRYTFVVYLAPKEGCCFAQTNDILVSINGMVAEVRPVGDGTLMALYEWKTGKEPEKVQGVVTFDIEAPTIGAHPSFEPKDNRDDGLYYLDKQHENSTKNGVTWYEGVGDNQRKMTEDDTFKAGENYYVAIRVKPIQGYEFDTDEEGDLLVGGAINGVISIAGGNEEAMFVGYAFKPLEETAKEPEKEIEQPKEPENTDKNSDDFDCKGDSSCPQFMIFFDDAVPYNHYAHRAIDWAIENQITNGIDSTHFGPDKSCTRGQVVTFLWRAAGCPEPKSSNNPFKDVKTSDYFYKPILWAVENGVTAGTSKTEFSPNATCSSAHILTFLYRAAGVGTDGWYEEARLWAEEGGLLNGTGLTVTPKEECPRAAVVTFLYRFISGH